MGHPFPQRHNQIFERIHDGRDFEVHVTRFNIFNKAMLSSRCIIHEMPLELRTEKTPIYYLSNALNHVKEMLRIIKQESIDLVVAGNLLPPLLLELADRLSRLRLPFIFDLQDYYPTSATGYICGVNSTFGTAVKGAFEGVTQTLLRMADAVTVPGVALAMYARRVRRAIRPNSIYIIPNGISEHFLIQHDGNIIREKLGYGEDDLVVGYVGSIEFWLDMKTLIRAVSKAHQDGLGVRLMLVGGRLQTGYAEKVMEWIKHYRIERITNHVGFVKYEKVPEYVAAMNVGTIPFDVENPTAYYAAPNKLWEYLSQEVNVISTPIPETLAYKSLVNMARVEDEYIAALKNCERKISREKYDQEIKTHIKKRTWNKSAECFKEIISNLVMYKQ